MATETEGGAKWWWNRSNVSSDDSSAEPRNAIHVKPVESIVTSDNDETDGSTTVSSSVSSESGRESRGATENETLEDDARSSDGDDDEEQEEDDDEEENNEENADGEDDDEVDEAEGDDMENPEIERCDETVLDKVVEIEVAQDVQAQATPSAPVSTENDPTGAAAPESLASYTKSSTVSELEDRLTGYILGLTSMHSFEADHWSNKSESPASDLTPAIATGPSTMERVIGETGRRQRKPRAWPYEEPDTMHATMHTLSDSAVPHATTSSSKGIERPKISKMMKRSNLFGKILSRSGIGKNEHDTCTATATKTLTAESSRIHAPSHDAAEDHNSDSTNSLLEPSTILAMPSVPIPEHPIRQSAQLKKGILKKSLDPSIHEAKPNGLKEKWQRFFRRVKYRTSCWYLARFRKQKAKVQTSKDLLARVGFKQVDMVPPVSPDIQRANRHQEILDLLDNWSVHDWLDRVSGSRSTDNDDFAAGPSLHANTGYVPASLGLEAPMSYDASEANSRVGCDACNCWKSE